MKKQQVKLLKRIVETPSPTGFETGVAQVVRDALSDIADEIRTDSMGSVHATYQGNLHHDGSFAIEEDLVDEEAMVEADLDVIADDLDADMDERIAAADDDGFTKRHTLMFAAHMDEIGLMVTYISQDGFLSISAIGGVDAAILPGMRVDVHTKAGILRGVVGRKPIHLIDPDERKGVTPLDKLVIDLGMPAKKVRKKVSIGDPITFAVGFERFGQGMAVSRAFDDKAGVFVGCRVMQELAADPAYMGSFVAALTVQEEIGTRGAMTSAHSLEPDVAIAFDVTHATDYPGIDKAHYGEIVCGKGPVIARGPNINPVVFERLVAAAEAEGIDYQIEAEPSVTGTDARAIQVTRDGIPTGLISIPLRYMHTPTEVIDLGDLQGAVKLIARFAKDLDSARGFIPGGPEDSISDEKILEDGFDDIEYLTGEVERLGDELADLQTIVELGAMDDEDDDAFIETLVEEDPDIDEAVAAFEQKLASEVDERLAMRNRFARVAAAHDEAGAAEEFATIEQTAASSDVEVATDDEESAPPFLKQQGELSEELREYSVDVNDAQTAADAPDAFYPMAPAIKISLIPDDDDEYEDEYEDGEEEEGGIGELEVADDVVSFDGLDDEPEPIDEIVEEVVDDDGDELVEEDIEMDETVDEATDEDALEAVEEAEDLEDLEDLADEEGVVQQELFDEEALEVDTGDDDDAIDDDAEADVEDDLESAYDEIDEDSDYAYEEDAEEIGPIASIISTDVSDEAEGEDEDVSDTITYDQTGANMPTMSMPIVTVTSTDEEED